MSCAFHRLQCWRCVSLLATPRWPRPGWSPRSPTSAAGTWATLWTRWRSSWRGTRPLRSPPLPGRSASLRWSASPRYGKQKTSAGSRYSQMNSRFWSCWVSQGRWWIRTEPVFILLFFFYSWSWWSWGRSSRIWSSSLRSSVQTRRAGELKHFVTDIHHLNPIYPFLF